ncbi:MAG: hypothetical protein SGJ02_14470, partial [bacterium]|nr:hypothetical protein [bacterium]
MDKKELQKKALNIFTNFSKREKTLVFGGILFLVIFTAYITISSILESFAAQETKVLALQRNFTSINMSLDRYDKLLGRLKGLEKSFKKDGPKDGVRSYLESTVINKAHVPAGQFSIKPGMPRTLGENYSQSPFSISFATTSLTDLVSFLKEVSLGDSSLLLTKLEVIKGRNAEKLSVTVDVSSITNA